MKYFYISEGKIGRIDTTTPTNNLQGLCTDNFTSCNIIVLIAKNETRFSLIHADQSLHKGTIQQEIDWVGTDCFKFVCLRSNGYKRIQLSERILQHVLSDLQKNFERIYVPEDIEVISIQPNQKQPQLLKTLPEAVAYHPQILALTARHIVEGAFGYTGKLSKQYKTYAEPLIYSQGQWQLFADITLSEHTKTFLARYKISSLSSPYEVYAKKPSSASKDEQWAYYNAAIIYCYFYISTNRPFTLRTFIKECFNNFCQTYNSSINIKSAEFFIAKSKNAKNSQQLESLLKEVNSHFESNQNTLDQITYSALFTQIAVTAYAFKFLFETFDKKEFKIEKIKILLETEGLKYHQDGTFFSPSKFATLTHPYGPYADHYCKENDNATQLCMQLTKLSN